MYQERQYRIGQRLPLGRDRLSVCRDIEFGWTMARHFHCLDS